MPRKSKKLFSDSAFNAYLEDQRLFQNATHANLLRLARAFLDMELGDLVKIHKSKAAELGATAPSVVFIRAIIIARMAASMKGEKL